MPSCQPLKAFNHLFCVYFLSSPHIYLFIYTKSFGFYLCVLKISRCLFLFLDALGDVGEYLKKKYIGRGMRKVFKELKA